MKTSNYIIRTILIVIFIFIAIISILLTAFIAWITIFGIGWGGGQSNLQEIIWNNKGFVLLSATAIISSIGLIKNKKYGIAFGYIIPIGIWAYYIIILSKDKFTFDLENIFWFFIFIVSSIGILWGLSKIKNLFKKLNLLDFIISLSISCILLLSFYFDYYK